MSFFLVVANATGTQVHLVDADREQFGNLCGYRFRSNSQVGTYAMIGPESISPQFACQECRDTALNTY